MITNRVTQLIYRTIYCVLAGVGVVASFGLFMETYNTYWFLSFNDLVNYASFGLMIAVLAINVRQVIKGENAGNNKLYPRLKFYLTALMLISFLCSICLVYTPATPGYFSDIRNLCFNLILPVMFILDFMMFDKKHIARWYDPLIAMGIAAVYAVIIIIINACTNFFVGYYSFMDVTSIGYGVMFAWLIGILIVMAIVAYLLWLYDKLVKVNGAYTFDFKNKQIAEGNFNKGQQNYKKEQTFADNIAKFKDSDEKPAVKKVTPEKAEKAKTNTQHTYTKYAKPKEKAHGHVVTDTTQKSMENSSKKTKK